MDLDKALRLLRLPREVGAHPEDGKMILAGIGRYGPYVQHDGTYANLPTADEVFEVGLNRAVAVLAEKRAGGGARGRGAAAALDGAGRPPGRRRAGARAVRPLRPLRQARRDQRQRARAGPTRQALTLDEAVKAARRPRGQGRRRQEAGAAKPAARKPAAAKAKKPKTAAKKAPAKKPRREDGAQGEVG